MLPAESEANLRRARIEARWSLRHCKRELGGYDPRDVIYDIRMAGWLAERIRVETPDLSAERLATMRAHLLRKLAMAELIVTDLVARSSVAGAGNS